MKNMLEEAIRVGARSRSGSLGQDRQRVKWFRKQSEGSEGDEQESGNEAERYTSSALSSDDDYDIFSKK